MTKVRVNVNSGGQKNRSQGNHGYRRIQKQCFVIAPIGDEGSEVRNRSDQILTYIIEPVAQKCGYEPLRADSISKPGIITAQIIEHLIEDPLVIADLTGKNPNVLYELAIRHVIRKPAVQIIQTGESLPFDIAASRTIQVDHHDLHSVDTCKKELEQQIHNVEKDPNDIDNPVSITMDLQVLKSSQDPIAKSNTEIIGMLQLIVERLNVLGEVNTRFEIDDRTIGMLRDLDYLIKELNGDLILPEKNTVLSLKKTDRLLGLGEQIQKTVSMLGDHLRIPMVLWERTLIKGRRPRAKDE